MGAELLRFPGTDPDYCPPSFVNTRPAPKVESIGLEAARDLLRVSGSVVDNAKRLVDYVDGNRAIARQAGIETIAIELSGILEGGHLDRVVDALEYSLGKDRPAQVTDQGLAKLRRAEGLVAEAGSNIARHTPYGDPLVDGLEGPPPPMALGQRTPSSSFDFSSLFAPILIVGVIAIAVVVWAPWKSRK